MLLVQVPPLLQTDSAGMLLPLGRKLLGLTLLGLQTEMVPAWMRQALQNT